MKRRTALKSGFKFALGSAMVAAVEPGKYDAAADVLKHAADSGQVDAACLCVQQGESVWSRAFGAAESVDDIFLLASISKPITVAAVMTLADERLFNLDDTVHRFLPEFEGNGRERITMRQLFTHCSGLPDQLPQNASLRANHSELAVFVEAAIRTPLLFPPGSKYGYSSMAILLASEVARRISGMPIAALVNERVYKPLELKNSALGIGRLKREALMQCQVKGAASESGSGDSTAKDWDWNSDYWRKLGVPWGGAHGSAPDVARFLSAFLRPQSDLLRPETARLMTRNHNPPGIRPRGLGFDLGGGLNGPKSSQSVFGHSGSTGTLCWADPTTDSICVVLTTLPARAVKPHPRDVAARKVAEQIEHS